MVLIIELSLVKEHVESHTGQDIDLILLLTPKKNKSAMQMPRKYKPIKYGSCGFF